MHKGLESSIEKRAVAEIRKAGCLALKLMHARGWPDRLILIPGGVVLFLEFKRPGGFLRPIQSWVHGRLERRGFDVVTVDTVDAAVREVKLRMPERGLN